MAWQTAHIMNLWSKRRITMHRLIGSRRGVINADDYATVEDFVQAVNDARATKQNQ